MRLADRDRGRSHRDSGEFLRQEYIVTRSEVRFGLAGFLLGMVCTGIAWVVWSVNLGRNHELDRLHELAKCDERGWVTVHFPSGGEYLCTLVRNDPVPPVKPNPPMKPKRNVKPVPPAPPEPSKVPQDP